MRRFLMALAVAASASLISTASAATLFSSDGTDLVARFGLTGTPGTAPDGSVALEVGGTPGNFPDLLNPGGLIPVPASELGLDFVLSFDVYIPSGSNIDRIFPFVRFYDDADDNGSLSFGGGSEFANRVEIFGTEADFTLLDQFQTIQVTGRTIPLVDQAGGAIDNLQFNLAFRQNADPAVPVTAFVNNVSLVTIPEPSTFAMLALTGLAAAVRRRV